MIGTSRHPQPDPRSQGRADVLGHPDRQQRRHADAGPEPAPTWCKRNVISAAEARGKAARFPRTTSLGGCSSGPRHEKEHDHGTRPGHQIHQRPAAADGRRNGCDLFITADFPPAIKVDGKVTKVSPQPLTAAHTLALARSIMNDKQAAEFERTKECNFAISPPGIGRFRVNAFVQQGKVGMVLRVIPQILPTIDEPGRAAGAQGRGDDQARPGHPGGRHRLGQVDHAGGHDRLAQREQLRPHHHHRGPGRVRAPAQELRRHAARSGPGHRQLGSGAEEHAAPGARRDPDGRDPRPRDHGARHRLRRNRPPVHGHAARQQRQPGAGPHDQLLPRRAPRRSC